MFLYLYISPLSFLISYYIGNHCFLQWGRAIRFFLKGLVLPAETLDGALLMSAIACFSSCFCSFTVYLFLSICIFPLCTLLPLGYLHYPSDTDIKLYIIYSFIHNALCTVLIISTLLCFLNKMGLDLK